MHMCKQLCSCLCIHRGVTLETLSLSLRPSDGGLVLAWHNMSYIMMIQGWWLSIPRGISYPTWLRIGYVKRLRDGGLSPA